MTLKKIILTIGATILAFILCIVCLLAITGNNYVYRGVYLTYMKGQDTANIDDYTDFDNREIKTSTYQPWQPHEHLGSFELSDELLQVLDADQTIAFAVLKDGKLLYENYWQGYSADSKTNSFSMAKSITTMLYLKAVEDGYISRYDAPITELLPEYADNQYAKECTLADLSAMTAGYDWNESYYLPLNPTAKAYYGKNLEEQILSRDFVKPCGDFNYLSGSTQLLGIALKRALEPHGYTASSYLEKHFWQPLGMKNSGYWSLDDSSGIEKFYCCISAGALDYAKFGQLMLNNGQWNGKQLLSQEHIELMVTPNAAGVAEGSYIPYGHSIWTDMTAPVPFYGMVGHLGQRVLVLPEENVVIVRLGHSKVGVNRIEGYNTHDSSLAFYVDDIHKSIEAITTIDDSGR